MKLLLIVFCFEANSQDVNSIEIKGLGATFIVEGSIGDKLLSAKCPCSMPKGGKCGLYDFQVTGIVKNFENNVFTNEQLLNVTKILISDNVVLQSKVNLILILQPGTSKEYVQFTDILDIDLDKEIDIKHLDGYLSDLVKCKRKDKFAKYLE